MIDGYPIDSGRDQAGSSSPVVSRFDVVTLQTRDGLVAYEVRVPALTPKRKVLEAMFTGTAVDPSDGVVHPNRKIDATFRATFGVVQVIPVPVSPFRSCEGDRILVDAAGQGAVLLVSEDLLDGTGVVVCSGRDGEAIMDLETKSIVSGAIDGLDLSEMSVSHDSIVGWKVPGLEKPLRDAEEALHRFHWPSPEPTRTFSEPSGIPRP